jgi:hypothetical protein
VNRKLTTLTPTTNDEHLRRSAITFYPGITNKLQNIFKKHKIKIVCSNNKLTDFFENSKDELQSLEKCDTATRFSEHLRHIRNNHPNISSLASNVLKRLLKSLFFHIKNFKNRFVPLGLNTRKSH